MSLNYVTYSDILFEHFFNPGRKGQATTLSFDEEESKLIAESVGEPPDGFSATVMSSVRDIYRSGNGFGWWRNRHPRERTALLACSVLIMSSRSPGDEDDGFYRQYYRDVLGVDSTAKQNEYAIHSVWWRDLQRYLNGDCAGSLGRLVFLEVVRLTHLNYPASQSILRGSDKRWLWQFFSRTIGDPTKVLTRDRFLAIWRPGASGESVGVTRMGEKLRGNDEIADQIWDIFSGEYEAWRNDPVQQAVIARRRIGNPSRRSISSRGHLGIGERSRLDDDPDVYRIRSRYALSRPTFPVNSPYALRLEVFPPQGADMGPRQADGWVRIPDHNVTARQFVAGFTITISGLEVHVRGSDAVCFVDGETGLSAVNTFPSAQRIMLLYDEDVAPDLGDFLERNLLDGVVLALSEELRGLIGVGGTIDPRITEEDLPEVLRRLFSRSNMDLSLRLGLRLASGVYVQGAPPLLLFIHPIKAFATLYIDGQEAGSVRRGLNRLPADLPPGVHTISVLEHERRFRIAFPDDLAAETPDLRDNDLGFVVRLRPPLVQTDSHALATPRAELMAKNAVVIQGADIMLPYARTV
jgi:hypothetical protein